MPNKKILNTNLNPKSKIQNPKYLICFDLDGVLIDSMTIANRIFFELVEKKLGLPTEQLKNDRKTWAIAAEDRFGLFWKDDIKKRGITDKQIQEIIDEFRQKKIKADIPVLPHAKKMVELMAEHFENLASVSSNANFVIEKRLEKIGLRKYFKKVTGKDGVKMSKPHPEIYLKTIEFFGLPADHALTIEDSSHGITAAKRAGMKAIGVATGVETFEELKKITADHVLHDLSELTVELVFDLLSLKPPLSS